jgi:S1-C subfamily serine protease
MTRTKHVSLRELYLRYGGCMAYVASERDGIEGIGSAFHIGEGIFVTARHVVEGRRIKEMRVTDGSLLYSSDLYPREPDGSVFIRPDSPSM